MSSPYLHPLASQGFQQKDLEYDSSLKSTLSIRSSSRVLCYYGWLSNDALVNDEAVESSTTPSTDRLLNSYGFLYVMQKIPISSPTSL